MKIILWLTLLLFHSIVMVSQEYPLYRMYTFEEFTKEHFIDSTVFIREFNNVVHYPSIAREHEIEGLIEVQLINHSDSSYNVLFPNGSMLNQSTIDAIAKTRKVWIQTKLPFIVNFCIVYDLDFQVENDTTITSNCPFIVSAYSTPFFNKKKDAIHHGSEVNYLPQIDGYPTFMNFKNRKKYPKITSIEVLIQETIKYCCQKDRKFVLAESTSEGSHADWSNYIKPTDYLRLVINTQGHITDLTLYGKLLRWTDVYTLNYLLNSVYYKPALRQSDISQNLIAVPIALEFQVEK